MTTRTCHLAFAAAIALLVTGCGGKSNTSEQPVAPSAGGVAKGNVEVVSFQGGYGIDFFEQTGKEFMAISDEVIVLVSADTVAALQEHSLISLFQGATVFRFGKTDSEAVEYFRVPLV